MQNEFKNNMNKMRVGTGAANLLYGGDTNSHHYIDSLERFQKDFATVQKQRRQQQKMKKQSQIQKKRIQYLERQSKRWENVQKQIQKQKQSRDLGVQMQTEGRKRTANNNSLPYNPISLQYQKSNQGQKLKNRDEDNMIRGYVRAHNMDNRGNSKYNPLTGQDRLGIQKLIPENLHNRFDLKLNEHYDNFLLRAPSSNNSISNRQKY